MVQAEEIPIDIVNSRVSVTKAAKHQGIRDDLKDTKEVAKNLLILYCLTAWLLKWVVVALF